MNLTGNTYRGLWVFLMIAIFWMAAVPMAMAQGSLKGKVFDELTKEPLAGATVFIVGTYKGGITDEKGNFNIEDVKKGDYTIRVTYIGYAEKLFTGIKIAKDKPTTLNAKMASSETVLDAVVIEGEPNLVDLEDAKSGISITAEDIDQMNVRDVQDVVAMQVGVNVTPDGLSVRGGRVYETQFMIDGISANDPLAGTGFGVDVSANAVGEVDVVTGGGDVEYGGGTSGVINTKIKEGGKKYRVNGSYYRDNLGFNVNRGMSWNEDRGNLSLSGPVPFTRGKVSFFGSGSVAFSDDYFRVYADQLHSSLFPSNDSLWAPRQSNKLSHTAKITYNIKPGLKLSLSNQHSLSINQNSRSLQVIGNDAIMQPGLQYGFSLDADNGNTYTHHSNLSIVNLIWAFKEQWTMNVSLGRLFTNLRADANGRPFRESTVDRIFDPASIVTDPVDVFNPDDSVVYVFPGPGLVNNGGIATLWHDHYAQEYTVKYKFTWSSPKKVHFLTFGQEHKEQEYQWIDVTRPWVGAPIQIDDTTRTTSTSIGSTSDYWKANPASGGFYLQDEIRYKGIIAFIGARFEYWAPGKFVDNAVDNPDAPITDGVREQYLKQSVPMLGRRWKARILPKLRVSFPITANNVLYFNYGHATRLPHPRFMYAGLDPVYQDRSFLSNLGNPNINPEVAVNYEVGLKSQITKDLALTVTAFYNDKFDYIVSRSIIIDDGTGRLVTKRFFINQDYARIRGVEIGVTKRIKKWFKANLTAAYQIATGKSNSAAESSLQIATTGFVGASKEQFLAWDRPFDVKGSIIFKPDTTLKLFGKIPLNGWRVFLSATFKSGLRYTPYVLTDTLDSGRPVYDQVVDQPFSKIGSPWFWADLRISRDIKFKNGGFVSFSFEVQNLFNNKNAQIINGVTGKAYRDGDPLPLSFRDPAYPNPQDRGTPPTNPARFMKPRHMLFGVKFQF